MRPTKILILGASGLIGTAYCRELENNKISSDRYVRKAGIWPENVGETLDLSQYSALVHLGVQRIKQSDAWEEIEAQNITPLAGVISAIKKTQPNCLLVFVSSQSASPRTSAKYGRMKWHCEKMLERSGCRYVIVRPGLVLGAGHRGLFSAILRMLRTSPIVPLVGAGRQIIQPVSLRAVAKALAQISSTDMPHAPGAVYNIALPPMEFRDFLTGVSRAIERNPIFLPIPTAAVTVGLWLLEKIMESPPLTRSNLEGLLNLEAMEVQQTQELLSLRMPSLDESIREALNV